MASRVHLDSRLTLSDPGMANETCCIVNVDICAPLGIDRDVNNEIPAFPKRSALIEKLFLWNKRSIRGVQHFGIPVFMLHDLDCQVANGFREHAPLVWTRGSPKSQPQIEKSQLLFR